MEIERNYTNVTFSWFKKNLVLLVILSVFLLSRSLFLDADLPPFEKYNYQPIDEFYYSLGAFNLVEETPSDIADFSKQDYLPISIFPDVITAGTLLIFGDNYYGLRFASVVCGALILIVFYSILKTRFNLLTAFYFSSLLLVDTGFLLSNRIAEPTIFRLLFTVILIYILIQPVQKLRFGCLVGGIISTCFVFFVYPTNFFIIPAAFIICLLHKVENRAFLGAFFTTAAYFGIGVIISLILFLVSFALAANNWDLVSQIQALEVYTKRSAVSSGGSGLFSIIRQMVSNFIHIRDASFFKYNLYFLLLTLASSIYFSYTVIKDYLKRKTVNVDVIIFVFFFLFVAQTLFVNDYPTRKLIIMLPFLIYTLAFMFSGLKAVFEKRGITSNLIYLPLIPVIIISLLTQYDVVYKRPTYHFKDAMISLRKYNNKIVAGNFSYAFRLYNSYYPVLNVYRYKYTNWIDHQRKLRQLSSFPGFAGTISYNNQSSELLTIGICESEKLVEENNISFFKQCK